MTYKDFSNRKTSNTAGACIDDATNAIATGSASAVNNDREAGTSIA